MLGEHLAQGDLAGMSSLGHRMKSVARTVGANLLADRFEVLEQSASAMNVVQAQAIIAGIQEHFTQICAELVDGKVLTAEEIQA